VKIQILAILIGNALLASSGAVLIRYGGRHLDWSQGLPGVLHTGKLWLAGIFMGWIAGLVLSLLLTRHELVVLFVAYLVLNLMLVALGGYFVLGESLSRAQLLGICLALLSIYLLVRG
jgi:drug/metabolite transporter (DMT)-like permease